LRRHEVGEHPRLIAWKAEAAHHDVDVEAKRTHEFGNVHTGPAVDLWWIFSG
jgi:hypothetical protein